MGYPPTIQTGRETGAKKKNIKIMFINTIFRTISNSTALLVGAGIFNVIATAIMTHMANTLETSVGAGSPPPDLWFGYDSNDIYDWLEHIGPHGRKQYLSIIAWDLLPYMEAYAIFLGSLLLNECKKANCNCDLALIFPLVMAFDVVETLTNGYAVMQYPNRIDPIIVEISSVANMSKWVSFGVGLSLLVALFVAGALRKNQQKQKKSD